MNRRDFEYIENRLLDWPTRLLEAHAKLQKCGEVNIANELMADIQMVTDNCRSYRYILLEGNKIDGSG